MWEMGKDLLGQYLGHLYLAFMGDPRDVWGQYHAFVPQQAVEGGRVGRWIDAIQGRSLELEHIQARTDHLTSIQGIEQGAGMHHATA